MNAVVNEKPPLVKRCFLEFSNDGPIKKGDEFFIEVRTYTMFRPWRFREGFECDAFVIEQVWVNKTAQMPRGGAVPGIPLAALVSPSAGLKIETAIAGNTVALKVHAAKDATRFYLKLEGDGIVHPGEFAGEEPFNITMLPAPVAS